MTTAEEYSEADRKFNVYVKTAPARQAMADARKSLLEAASVFYEHGCRELGDKYKALADQLPRTDW